MYHYSPILYNRHFFVKYTSHFRLNRESINYRNLLIIICRFFKSINHHLKLTSGFQSFNLVVSRCCGSVCWLNGKEIRRESIRFSNMFNHFAQYLFNVYNIFSFIIPSSVQMCRDNGRENN